MNSTTSTDVNIGDDFYIPFWIVLQFLDTAPPDPFVKATVINKKLNTGTSPDGQIKVLCCDLECRNGVIVSDIPISYLIKHEDLGQWANNIAEWFKDFPEREANAG